MSAANISLRNWLGLKCWLRLCPFRPDREGAHCAYDCGRKVLR